MKVHTRPEPIELPPSLISAAAHEAFILGWKAGLVQSATSPIAEDVLDDFALLVEAASRSVVLSQPA
jgi:hypothetical protein